MPRSAFQTLLQEPGVVGDQHRIPVTEPLGDIGTEVVAYALDVPIGSPQQPLHPVRAHLASGLGQRPPVLALEARDQPGHILPGTTPRLRPGEPATDTGIQRIQLRCNNIHNHPSKLPNRVPLQY